MRAARSAMTMVGVLVLPPISVSMTEASATRSPSLPAAAPARRRS
jgi:hypothetical protein